MVFTINRTKHVSSEVVYCYTNIKCYIEMLKQRRFNVPKINRELIFARLKEVNTI